MAAENEIAHRIGSGQSPDPSLLTTAALLREIAILKEQFRTELAGEVKVIEARLLASDKATVVFEAGLTRVPTAVDRAVNDLRMLHEVKFEGVQVQLAERDTKVSEVALATRTAVDAALAAAEKARSSQAESAGLAAGKAEAAFAKALEQQAALSQTTTSALRDQIDDVKDRLARIEAAAIQAVSIKQETHSTTGASLNIIGIVISFTAILITLGWHLLGK